MDIKALDNLTYPIKKVTDSEASDLILSTARNIISPFHAASAWLPLLAEKIKPRIAAIPSERLQTPEPHILVPALQAFTYTPENLQEMLLNLISKNMDSSDQNSHPSFVEIIKCFSKNDVLVLANLARSHCISLLSLNIHYESVNSSGYQILKKHVNLGRIINNKITDETEKCIYQLERFGIISTSNMEYVSGEKVFNDLNSHPAVKDYLDQIPRYRYLIEVDNENDFFYHTSELTSENEIREKFGLLHNGLGLKNISEAYEKRTKKGLLEVTPFGRDFIDCCMVKISETDKGIEKSIVN